MTITRPTVTDEQPTWTMPALGQARAGAPGVGPPGVLSGVVRAMRPEQWLKNLLVFVAPVVATRFDVATLAAAAGAFAVFTLAAGGTYLANDVVDRHADAQHPRKCRRPVASGRVPVDTAVVASAGAAVGAFLLPFAMGAPLLGATILGYLVLSGAYNLGAKHIAGLELVLVTSLFVLRALGGATATGIAIPLPLLVALAATAFALVAGKRYAELRDHGASAGTRHVLASYGLTGLSRLRLLGGVVATVAYATWTVAAASRGHAVPLLASNVPVALGFLRYTSLLDDGRGEQPERLVWADPTLLVTIVLTVTSFGVGAHGMQ